MDANSEKKNRTNLTSSSLVALKAELLAKQAQVERAKAAGIKVIHHGGERKKAKETEKKNTGVEQRAKKDEEEKEEEEPSLEKSRIALEEKAKLYEKLSKDKTLLEEDTITEENSAFLVDFQQKVVKETVEERRARLAREKARKQQILGGESDEDTPPSNPEEEWVDFVDSLGRKRRCLRKDLAYYQQQDEEFYKEKKESKSSSATYSNFVKSSSEKTDETDVLAIDEETRKKQREKWEEEEAANSLKSNLHYQDILYEEARQHGVGFYSFSRNEEERAKQMEELEKLRQQTETARAQVIQSASQKRDTMEARLQKVRDRKRAKLGLAPKSDPILPPVAPAPEPEKIIDRTKEAEEKLRQSLLKSLPQTAKVRPWDFGKEGMPQKKEVMTQETWVEKRREDRVPDFAPVYDTKPKKEARIDEESIAAGLAFFKHRTSVQTTQSSSSVQIESSDDELQPPGEDRGTAIPPPSSMDYYQNQRKSFKSSSKPFDVSASFKAGIKEAKH